MFKNSIKRILTIISFCAPLISEPLQGASFPDFSNRVQNFVLEEKQIVIPEYPDAFNPSIVRWKDGNLLLCFRARDPLTQSPHLMGFVWLNEDYEPVSNPSILKIEGGQALKVSRAQDPKLFTVGNQYYIAYNNLLSDDDLETRRMLVAPLHEFLGMFFIIEPQYLLNFTGDPKNWREKNWSPFDYHGKVMFSYSLNPHRVFLPTLTDNSCRTMALTNSNITWPWGELRGGTPSILDGNEYFGVFHSYHDLKSVHSKGEKISHYFMGAYRFKSHPPFNFTHISPEPIFGSLFYTPPEYPTWKPLRVVFPGGLIMDESNVWVVYGRQDHECWVVKLDKQGLMDSLVPLHENKSPN